MTRGSTCSDGVRKIHGSASEWRTFAFGEMGILSGAASVIVFMLLSLSTVFPAVDAQAPANSNFDFKANHAAFKGYSGLRRRLDTSRLIYWCDQTIAVIEVVERRVLVNCELIEIYRPGEEKLAFDMLRSVGKPYKIDFKKMMKLMRQCHELDVNVKDLIKSDKAPRLVRPKPSPPPEIERTSSLFSGILPGTLWCGTGDLAETYFDLGQDRYLDRCCRSHDLCPVKVQGSSTKYNITNHSIYTKSHCECDQNLLNCLKQAGNSKADLMGNIYFNLLRVQCVQDGEKGKYFKNPNKY